MSTVGRDHRCGHNFPIADCPENLYPVCDARRLLRLLDETRSQLRELRIRLTPLSGAAIPGKCLGRTRNAYVCGFERAWRGLGEPLVYADSQTDYLLAEREGRLDGAADVSAALAGGGCNCGLYQGCDVCGKYREVAPQ